MKLKYKLQRTYINLRSIFRDWMGYCNACGSNGKDYQGKDRIRCNRCDKLIKIK